MRYVLAIFELRSANHLCTVGWKEECKVPRNLKVTI